MSDFFSMIFGFGIVLAAFTFYFKWRDAENERHKERFKNEHGCYPHEFGEKGVFYEEENDNSASSK